MPRKRGRPAGTVEHPATVAWLLAALLALKLAPPRAKR